MTLVGVGLLIVGGLTIWRFVRTPDVLPGARLESGLGDPRGRGRFRAGPWPGLSPAGAGALVGCALVLAGGQLLVGDPRSPVPDLPLLAVLAVSPLVLATRLVGAPGVAAAVCGAYLLPRTLLSLVDPSIEPPPLLLVPALAFDASAWLRWADLAHLRYVWPGGQSQSRRRRRSGPRSPRRSATSMSQSGADVTPGVTPRFYAGGGRRGTVGPRRVVGWRAAVAGAVFGAVLTLIEPPFAVLLGADPAVWSGPNLWLAGGLSALACALAALALGGRGTAA